MQKFFYTLASAAAFSTTSLSLHAADDSANSVVVTATRTARTADESLASVTVITREDIERRQAQDIVDLLRTQAGIDVTRSGGPSGDTALFLRGTNSNHVLVLIDGVRVASVTTGTFDWRSLPLSHIERIEIVRGPRASLYGSDAIGGVVQIFTRRARGSEIAAGVGSNRSRRVDMAWGNTGSTHIFFSGSDFATRGFSAQNPRGFSFDPDRDGAHVQSVSGGLDTDFGGGARLEMRGRQTRGDVEFDSGTQDVDNGSVNARLSYLINPTWVQTLTAGALNDELVTFQSFQNSRIRTKRQTFDWQNDFTLGTGSILTAGFAYLEESGISTTFSPDTTNFDRRQYNRAVFSLWQNQLGNHNIQLSGRYDDYSTFGTHGTWSAAYGYKFSTNTRVWASYGTGFHAPTFNQLYHPGCCGGLFRGNPDLKPERSRTGEIGLRYVPGDRHTVSVSLFSTHTDDLIDFSGPLFQAINISKTSMRGIELEHGYDAGLWRASTAVTLQRARDDATDTRLLRRSDRKLATFVERRFDHGSAGIELVAMSDRTDFDALGNTVVVAGYGILNVAGRYNLNKSLLVEGRLENLLDREYQVIEGFNTPGRSVFITLRYQPEIQP